MQNILIRGGICFFLCIVQALAAAVHIGSEQLWLAPTFYQLKGKQIGLITNHTAVNSSLQHTLDQFQAHASEVGYKIKAVFTPEHGLKGAHYAGEKISHQSYGQIPIYSLHGEHKRPTPAMLKGIDLLICDIQDIGSRSYTYVSTLFYMIEEAAKLNIPLMVLDRPNPINGLTVDGTMLEEKWRSFVGYVNVPYCHGMTIGELALYFNQEYHVGCQLTVVPMKGWKRHMTFKDTGLPWIPTSPQIPESDTPLYYPTTGILGELQIVNIGVGYTLPFKLIGAPWIQAEKLAERLNAQHFPGVYFSPFHYRPFFGKFAQENCQGVLIVIQDPLVYLPVSTQFLIMGVLKSLYPQEFNKALNASSQQEMFHKVNGTAEVHRILKNEKYVVWKLKELHQQERKNFLTKREKYLLKEYQ